MSFPRFRFTLSNTTQGTISVQEPDGWAAVTLKLERSEEFSGVIESFGDQQTFTFFEDGFAFIKSVRDSQGPDADVTITISISDDDGETYETLFAGLLDIEQSIEIDGYKIECPIVRNDLWTKFNTHRGTSVNLQQTQDLYGNNRIVLSNITLNMTPQVLKHRYEGDQVTSVQWALASNYGVIDFDTVTKDEVPTKYNYTAGIVSSSRPFELFSAYYDGSYLVEAELHLSVGSAPTSGVNANTNVYIQINEDAAIAFSRVDVGTPNVRTRFTYSATHTITKGDLIRIYILTTVSETVTWETGFDTFLRVTADTEVPETTARAFMIHEAFQSVLDRIIGMDNSLYSEYLGVIDTQQTDYAEDGCGGLFALAKGHQIRGFTFTDHPFFSSFDDLWKGANPVLNLGLVYETVDGVEVIRIEDKAYFFDTTQNSLNLNHVNNIEQSFYIQRIYKNIKIGYQKWEAESIPGIDDTQTKHEYAVQLKKTGSDIELHSKFIAASVAIEKTRREFLNDRKDWKLDNDTFIIAIDADRIGSPALVYEPELKVPFPTVSNLDNSDTRYNLRITPARNFIRWRNVFNSGLQKYTSNDYKFVGGEGNILMSAAMDSNDPCPLGFGGVTVAENGDFDITTSKLHDNIIYEFDHPLTYQIWKTIRDNKHKPIGVSIGNPGSNQTTADFWDTTLSHDFDHNYERFFILTLEYDINHSLGRFKLVKA